MALHTHIEAHRTPQPSGVEILDLRHFNSQHLRPLLEHETRMWRQLMTWDYRSSAEMILRYIDSKILPGYAAVKNGQVGGYAFFVYEGSKGVVGDLYADQSIQLPEGEGAVERLLAIHVIETLQQSPGIHRVEAQLLPHESGTLSATFVREGFRQFPRLFMTLSLKDGLRTQVPAPAEIEFRRWGEQDFQPAASVITAAYRGHIDSEINDQYRSLNGSLRFLNNIVRFPGCGIFDGNASFVAVNKVTRSVAGVLLCSRVKEDVGHITQVCILPEYRGKRIGESLIALCTQELRSRNFSALSLTVTEANTKAVGLYLRLGFDVKRRFDAFVWEG
ncbi:MAG TPA: GNAT family N-acetyltransferase [Candidatus Angelobacter sp.]|nr:GNAT family N-acetyltransferase [Candidatus Angelobacter sp.]